jgi:hypothetical protein
MKDVRTQRWIMLLAISGLVLTIAVTPAAGHVTDSLGHLVDHMKNVFYTQEKSDKRFVRSRDVESSGRITLFNEVDSTVVKKILVQNGPFTLRGVCFRNNIGDFQAEVWVYSLQEDSYLDSFGNGTDGALSRSEQFGGGPGDSTVGVLAVVPSGRYDSRTYTAIAPDGQTLTGTISAGAQIQEADCVFTATAQR